MHPLLYRFLLSSAGATAATGAIVFTAENRDRDLRKPKKRKKKSTGKGKKPSTDAKKAAKKKRDHTQPDPMARARRELATGSEPLPIDAFWTNIKNTPQAVADVVTGKAAREKEERKQKRAERRAKMTPAQRRADDRRRAKRRRAKEREEADDWGIGASIRAEVKKQVKDAATETIRETAEAASDRLKDSADIVKEKTSDAAKKIAEVAPDVAASAKSVADGATKLTKAIAESVPDSADGAKKGISALGRWVEGPGAQSYVDDDAPKQLTGPTAAVTPKESEAPTSPPTVTPRAEAPSKAGRSIVQRRLEAARKAAERGSTAPRPSDESRVRPVRADDDSGDNAG